MSAPLLICRPEPGASVTAGKALQAGLDPIVAPLFTVEALAWTPPDPDTCDAVVMTSANAARCGGMQLARYNALPAYAVGDATASAMQDAGFADIVRGTGDADALMATIAQGPHRRLLHLRGEDYRPLEAAGFQVQSIPVYRTVATDALMAAAIEALRGGAVAMLHSPRAASLFGRLFDDARLDRAATRIVAISPAAAAAAGPGWKSVTAAALTADAPMLAIARELCENAAR